MNIDYGLFREPLHVQMGVKKSKVKVFENILTWLIGAHLHGIITDGERDRALKRLDKKLHEIKAV